MPASPDRTKVFFTSGGVQCAAWHYPSANGACVIMAHGLGVTKEPGTDRFAARLNGAGYGVLAFDYRHIGESGGQPRQVARVGEQLEDWHAAIACARSLPDVDPKRVAIWGYSASGGHVFRVAAADPELAGAIAHAPLADGPAAVPNANRHQKPVASLRFTGRALRDAVGGLFGRDPLLIPLAGAPGTVTSLTTPDSQDGPRALNPGNRYPDWPQEIAARSALRMALYRPGRQASRVRNPLLVIVYDSDTTALPGPAIRAAKRAPRAELVQLPGGHYEGFLDGHDRAVEVLLSFLDRHLLARTPARNAPTPAAQLI